MPNSATVHVAVQVHRYLLVATPRSGGAHDARDNCGPSGARPCFALRSRMVRAATSSPGVGSREQACRPSRQGEEQKQVGRAKSTTSVGGTSLSKICRKTPGRLRKRQFVVPVRLWSDKNQMRSAHPLRNTRPVAEGYNRILPPQTGMCVEPNLTIPGPSHHEMRRPVAIQSACEKPTAACPSPGAGRVGRSVTNRVAKWTESVPTRFRTNS